MTPLTRILLRIFAAGFYKMHAGLLLATFLGGAMYLFFIGVLNQTHLTAAQIIRFRLIFVLTLINSPLIAGLMAVLWILYTLKSWKYIATQIALPRHQFLRYSSTAISPGRQRASWSVVQSAIMLPPLLFGIFALVNGIIFRYPLTIPLALLAITILLIVASAYRHVYLLNNVAGKTNNYRLARLMRPLPKPYFSLALYQLLHQEKVALAITKVLSAALLVTGTYLLADEAQDVRTAGLIVLSIAITHSVLLYRGYRFESHYLSFARNFPYSKATRYGCLVLAYALLTLPENLWIMINHPTQPLLLALNIGTGLFIYCTAYRTGPDMRRFLFYTFIAFITNFAGILFGVYWLAIVLNLSLSWIAYYHHYDHQDRFDHRL